MSGTFAELRTTGVSVLRACLLIGRARATHYRHARGPVQGPRPARLIPHYGQALTRAGAFGVQNPVVRALWPRRYRRSDVYRRLVALDRRTGLRGRLLRITGKADGGAGRSGRRDPRRPARRVP